MVPDSAGTSALIAQVEKIVDARLAELTPQMVKPIIEDMIRKQKIGGQTPITPQRNLARDLKQPLNASSV